MNAVRATLLAGIGLALFLLLFLFVPAGPGRTPPIVSSSPSPRLEASRAFHAPVPRSLDRPVPVPRPAPASVTGSTVRPTWPDGWPSLVPVRPDAARRDASGIQTMGSGPIDFYVPATTDPSAVDTEGGDDEADDEDANLERLGQMMRDRWEEDGDEAQEAPADPDPLDPDPAAADDEADDEDANLERLGQMMRDRWEEDGGEAQKAPAEPDLFDPDRAELDDGIDDGPYYRRRHWWGGGDEAQEAPADPDPFGPDPTAADDEADDEDANLERLGEMIRDRREAEVGQEEGVDVPPSDPSVADPADPAPSEEGKGDPGADGEDPTEEAASDVPPPVEPAPGYTLLTPEGRPVSEVILSQPFFVELRVLEEEDPGTETLDVAVRDEDGYEQTIVLHRDEEGSGSGVVRFVTRNPVSLAGEWGRNVFSSPFSRYEGTVDELDLDLDETGGSAIVRLASRDDVTGGFSTFGVYGDQVQLGLAAVERELDLVEAYLRDERRVAEEILADPATADDEALRSEARSWLDRIDNHKGIVDEARRHLENQEFPIFKLVYASELLGLIKNHDPAGGSPVRDRIVPGRGIGSVEEALNRARNNLSEYQTRGIVPPVAMNVIEGYLLGTYSAFAHLTGGAALYKLAEGTDEFGREGSRVAALVEIGAIVALVWLPPKIVDYVAAGGEFGVRVNLRPGARGAQITVPGRQISVGGRRGGRARAGPETVPSGSGRLAAETAGGQLAQPGTRGRRGLLPEELGARPGARAPGPAPAGLGMPADDVAYWRGRSGQRADEYLVQMDRVVTEARRRGVSDDAIEAALREARDRDVVDAVNFLEGRLEIEVALREGDRVFIGRPDRDLIQGFIDEGDDAIAAAHLERMSTTDLDVLESAIGKAHLEAQGKPQTWTPEELRFVESIVRRVDEGQNLASWKVADIDEVTITGPDGDVLVTGHQFTGAEPMFRQGDLEAILTVFGGRVRGVRGGRPVGSARPLASADEYASLLRRQNAGETLDLSGIARPGIVTSVMEGKLGLGQGAGRWDNTRPDGWLDVFVRAETKIPDGVDVRVLETDISAEVVRTANLLSSRGAAGTNPTLINAIVPEGSRWTRVQVRARDVRVRTSDTQRFVESEIGRLRDEGVDVGLLEEALAPLAPIEQMRVLRDPGARARAIRTGVAEPPPAGPARVVDPAADPAAFGGPSGRSGSGSIEAVFRSTGGSTGGVIEMFLVNHGNEDLRIRTEGLVLEPVNLDDPDDPRLARIERIVEAATSGKTVPSPTPVGGGTALSLPVEWRGARVVRVVVDAYCLEFERTVPGAGEVFQLADRETQQAHAHSRSIVAASRTLHQAGRLRPDTDPEDYYHSITQWAIWVDENSLDRAGFERDFVDHARRNVEAAGQEWNDRVEAVVRSLVPGRWDDVTMVLRTAGRPVSAGSP